MSAAVDHMQELEKASSMVMTARRLLARGSTVDLGSLELKIRRVCEGVLDLPREDGISMIPAMEKLINDLDRLAESVCERMDPPAAFDIEPQA
jgi:hypothetical protein